MDKVFHPVVFIEGVAVPIVGYEAAWSVQGAPEFHLALPRTQASRRLKLSSHVHIFLARGHEYRFSRQTVRTEKTDDALTSSWVEGHRDSIKDLYRVPLEFYETPGGGMALKDGVRTDGLIYRTGGEITKISELESTSGTKIVQIAVRPYSGLLDVATIQQLLGSRGVLNKKDVRYLGQHAEVYKGSGRRAFYNGFLKEIDDGDGDLAKALQTLVYRYGRVTNEMWRNRFSFARLSNQIASIPDDQAVNRVVGTKDFKKYIKELLESQQALPLNDLILQLMMTVQYTMVSIPSPSYFPVAPAKDQGSTKRVVKKRGRKMDAVAYIATPSGSMTVPNIDASKYRQALYAPKEKRFYTWNDSSIQPVTEDIPRMQVVPAAPRKRPGGDITGEVRELANNKLDVTWKIGDGFYGGPGSYSLTLPREWVTQPHTHKTVDVASDHFRKIIQDKYIAERPVEDYQTGMTTYEKYVATSKKRISFAPEKTMDVFPVVKILSERQATQYETKKIPPKPDGEELPNTVSKLNTNLLIPQLWWAMFPVCNVVTPAQLIDSIQIEGPSMDEPTRLIAKVPQGRSGWRRSYVDQFPAPVVSGLQEDWAKEDTLDPASLLHFNEYVSGPVPDLMEISMLYRKMRDKEWATYLRSYINIEYWNRKLGTRSARFTTHYDPSIVTGAPLLVIPSLGEASVAALTPEQKHLIQRLKALNTLRNSLKGCKRGVPKNILRHLYCLYNMAIFAEGYLEKKYPRGSWKSSGGSFNSDQIQQLVRSERLAFVEANSGVSLVEGEPAGVAWAKRMGMLPYGKEYPTSTDMNYWNLERAMKALGIKQEEVDKEREANLARATQRRDEFTEEVSQGIQRRVLGGEGLEALKVVQTEIEAREANNESFGPNFRPQDLYMIFPGKHLFFGHPFQIKKLIDRAQRIHSGYSGVRACNAALDKDIKKIDEAIKETRVLLRKYSAAPKEALAYIGYVSDVTDQWDAEGSSYRMQVSLTHVREIGSDLDHDDLAGDDVENAATFGDEGLFSDKYRRDKIGEEVYKPLFGTTTALNIPEIMAARRELDEIQKQNLDVEALEGLPPIDGQDVIAQFTHPAVCGHNCSTHGKNDPVSLYTESEVAEALIYWLNSLRKQGDEEYAEDVLQRVKTRAWMDVAEAYSGFPVLWGRDETRPEVVDSLREDVQERYQGDEPPIQGFWSTSFLGINDSGKMRERITPRKEDIDTSTPTLAEAEEVLLSDRAKKPQEMLEDLVDKTF